MITVTYYYSACVGIQTPDVGILCDPWFSDGAYGGSWYQYPKLSDPLNTVAEFDYLYISHIHPDHYDPAFLIGYLKCHPSTKVVIADFKTNFLSVRMTADGIDHTPYDEVAIGATRIKLFPNERVYISTAPWQCGGATMPSST